MKNQTENQENISEPIEDTETRKKKRKLFKVRRMCRKDTETPKKIKIAEDENPDAGMFDLETLERHSSWQIRVTFKEFRDYQNYVRMRFAMALSGDSELEFFNRVIFDKLESYGALLQRGDFISPALLVKRVYKYFKIPLYRQLLWNYRNKSEALTGYPQMEAGKHYFISKTPDGSRRDMFKSVIYEWEACKEYFENISRIERERLDARKEKRRIQLYEKNYHRKTKKRKKVPIGKLINESWEIWEKKMQEKGFTSKEIEKERERQKQYEPKWS